MNLKTDQDIIFPYTFDSSNFKGKAQFLFVPENIDELVSGVKYFYDNNIKITISGAGTGITGARVPLGGAVISMEKFNEIEFDRSQNTVKIGPAVTLKVLDEFLEPLGFFLPPNPTEYNASLGGNVATNASGARTFKYGAIRDFVVSMKVLLSNGDIINLKRGDFVANADKLSIVSQSGRAYNIVVPSYIMPKVKNASGYFANHNVDAVDLLIGSEGTLGIFCEVELKVITRPKNILGGVVYFDNNQSLLSFVNKLRNQSSLNNLINHLENNEITARLIEYFDRKSLDLLKPKYPEIPEIAVGAVWFEQEYNTEFEEKLMSDWYNLISEFTSIPDDTWFALNEQDHSKLKEFRHELPLQVYENLTNNSQKKVGLDTAVPLDKFEMLYDYYHENCPNLGLEYVIFGHIGNCHLHVNVFCKNDIEYTKALAFYDKSIELALSLGGTISAEHGIGKLKKKYLVDMYGNQGIDEMINVKRILDDKLILNIGTMFDVY